MTGGEITKQVMNTQQPKMGLSTTVLEYANNIGGVYIWYTERDDVCGVDYESTRFITQGQNSRGEGKGFHNSVLMRNPRCVQFPQNICPYQEQRFNHGFQKITKTDCCDLGIEYITLVDAVMTQSEGLKIEKNCQHILNDFQLGTQRLHRVPGAGIKKSQRTDRKNDESLVLPFFLPGFLKNIRISSSLEVAMDDTRRWILNKTDFPGIVVLIICVLSILIMNY
jgi:hypothetical protein